MRYLFLLLILLPSLSWGQKKMDILITNARIIDGSGNPWYRGEVGIRKGKIYAVGDLSGYRAKRTIDAGGLVVAPGFIDVHAHIEGSVLKRPAAANFIYDGVTSLVTGNCGSSRTDLAGFFKELEAAGPSINVASLVGHNSVRRTVMGEDNRAPTPAEMQAMKDLINQAMEDGAVGFSTGLIYVPGTYSQQSEVVALARQAARHGGVYASHIRNEANEIESAIEEAVTIGKEANMPVQISHFKLGSKTMWGKSTMTVGMIEQYREQGIDVTVDQYPYPASSTTLAVTIPSWALGGGNDSLVMRLQDSETKARIVADMKADLQKRGFADYQYAAISNCPWEESYNGKRIPEVCTMMGRDQDLDTQIETILEMVSKGPRIQMVFHTMSEDDVAYIMRYPYTLIASDAGITEKGAGMPHPRAYGTNSRVLGRYVREKGNLRLEEAIRKMTSLPAQRFQLHDRGLLRPGMAADVVIFDPERVSDEATFAAPHAYASGFSYVIVNGQIVVEGGKHLGTKAGQVLRLEN